MKRLLDNFDALLARITMYRLMLYGLYLLAAVALVFGLLGALPFRLGEMLASLAVLAITCFVVNQCLRLVADTPVNFESSQITFLILFFIVRPSTDLHDLTLIAAVAAAAMASKYLLAIGGKHIFNPAAAGLVIVSLSGNFLGQWWVATAAMLPFVSLLGLLIARKIQRLQMVGIFIIAALVTMLIVGVLQDRALDDILRNAFVSWPLVFFGTIMLTEPSTLPVKQFDRYVYALGIGLLFASQLHIGVVSTSPQNVLLLGNLYSYIVNPKYRLQLKLKQKIKLSDRTYNFVFTPNKLVTFVPGQYMEWTMPIPLAQVDSRGNRRTFTIASSPTEPDIHLGVKTYRRSSLFKQYLQNMQPGDTLAAGQIAGEFTLPHDTEQPLLFIAGGIGITPFRSMLKYLIDNNQQRDVVLFYATKADEVSYRDLLNEAKNYGTKIIIYHGQAYLNEIKNHVPDFVKRRIYISGSHTMVSTCENALLAANIPRKQLITDYFPGN